MRNTAASAPTILDVARRAGVSRTTVSRVLNEPDRVSPAILKRVKEATDALHYAPNSIARGLRSGRTGMIALLVGDIAQPFHGSLAQAVAGAAERRGMGVVLYDLAHSTSRLEDVLRKLLRQGVDGIILATADDISTDPVKATISELVAQGLPIVTGVEQAGVEGVATVLTDHSHSARIAIEALRQAGSTSPALLVADVNSPLARQLIIGARGATVIVAGYTFEAAADAVLALNTDVDALIVATIPMALGAMSALATQNRKMPVVVCEEVPLAHQVTPSFTTSAVATQATGEEMVRLVATEIGHTPIEPTQLTAQLIRRETF
ncbi:MAG TPA: LacI family DNA-binding transcriptional regulator [Microbacteriaceae bacterium]